MDREAIARRLAPYVDSPDELEAAIAAVLERRAYRLRRGEAPVKRCPMCRTAKPSRAFGSDASRPDGLSARCLDCDRARLAALRRT